MFDVSVQLDPHTKLNFEDKVSSSFYFCCTSFSFQEMYLNNPWYLVDSIQQILTAEKELIIKAEKVRMFLLWKNYCFAKP